jgi:serine/threonine protein kinase
VQSCVEKKFKLTYIEQLKFAIQITKGMEYISEKNLIHMDLAARNMLLHKANVVKIADFGLTRKLEPGQKVYKLTKTLKLPIKWMAIESMDEKIFSTKSDCWAFGVTLWEIMR